MIVLERVLSILAPHSCLDCGHEGSLLCNYCRRDLPALPSRCVFCQVVTTQHKTCDICFRKVGIRHVWVRTLYEGIAKELLRKYKFERAFAAHRPVALAMNDCLPYVGKDVLVVPVPTASTHHRLRGYDHAFLLAKQLAHQQKLVFTQPLRRTTQSRQVGATRKQRYEQLTGAMRLIDPLLVKGKTVLIVDDIVTSGATLCSVAKLLKQTGARQVNAVLFAQKVL